MNTLAIPGGWQAELDAYAVWLRAAGRPPSTQYQRLYHVRSLAAELGIGPYEVTAEQLLEYQAGHDDWSPHTRRARRSSIRLFYSWAHRTGRIPADPSIGLPAISVPIGKARPANDIAYQSGLRAADERVRLMVTLGARAGLRCSEIAAVHTDDVFRDMVGWSLRVVGKGSRTRIVPIADDLARLLLDRDPGFVFPGQIDGHLSGAYVSKLISAALPDGVTGHQLRHRFASRAFRGSGFNLRAVQELLGHASIATTQIYTAVDDDDLRQAALAAA